MMLLLKILLVVIGIVLGGFLLLLVLAIWGAMDVAREKREGWTRAERAAPWRAAPDDLPERAPLTDEQRRNRERRKLP